MAEIVLVTWDGGGNVPPLLNVGVELQRRGHGVRVVGHQDQAMTVAGAGLPFTAYRRGRPFAPLERQSPPGFVRLFGDRGKGQDVLEVVAEQGADLVVVDCLLPGVMHALAEAGVPYVALEHFFDAYLTSFLRGPIGLGLRMVGLRPERLLAGARARLVVSSPDLDPAAGRPGRVWTGPAVDGVPGRAHDQRVLVSLSTFGFPGQTETLQRVLDALGTLGVAGVVTTGPATDPDDLRVPDSVEVHRWLPHGEVLGRVGLLVGHGGHATTMAALAHDVPVLVLPLHPMLDQPMVGSAVQRSGAGRRMGKRSPADRLAPVVEQLLGDGPHRDAAARLGERIREQRGTATAADLVEQAVRP
ncbi:hypothetical protein GCM10027596_03970 [Nocardioides korecus]